MKGLSREIFAAADFFDRMEIGFTLWYSYGTLG